MINFIKLMPLVLLFGAVHACPMNDPNCGNKDVPVHEREAAKLHESAGEVAQDLENAEEQEEVFDVMPG